MIKPSLLKGTKRSCGLIHANLALDIGFALILLAISGKLCAQPVPHHFSGVAPLPDKTMTLTLDGGVSKMFNLTGAISNQFMQMFDLYPVEASTNLLDWARLAVLLRTNNNPNPLLFQDTNAAGLDRRFYRTPTNHLLTPFPKPTGPFAVGTIDRVMIDPTRTNLYRYSPRTNAFMVTFWYPADPPAPGVQTAGMWNKRFAADRGFIELIKSFGATYADVQWTNIAPNLVGHRFSAAPLAAGTESCPVVIYSVGVAASRQWASQLAEKLASHGYVVLAPDHPDCWATQFLDGRYLKGGSHDVSGRLKDMTFLVDELARMNQSDPLFAGRLDLDRIAVSGQSAGGMVVETCRTNSRVKCAAIWDATNLQLNTNGLQKPFLAAVGQFGLFFNENQWLFNKAITNAILLQIEGADHITATDAGWTWEIPWGRAPAIAYNACLLWFLDTYLKSEMRPFPTNPEIYNVQRK
jgi:dienelactone hydrolase